jgi:cell division septation protein DedD
MERQDEASVRIEETVVREIPLGSGINPRKKAPETTVATQKVEEQAGTDSQATSSAPEISAAKGGTELNKNSSSSSVAASEGGAYVVQVASFRDGADARALAQKVQPEFPAYVREADLGGKGKWSRVLVGPFVEREEADKVRSRLKESAKLDGFVKKAP